MKIGLVTNWDENCAVAEYARNLTEYCVAADKDVSFKVVTRPLTFEPVWERVKDVDVIHFNYCAHAFSGMDINRWADFRTIKPVVLTVHESTDWFVRRLAKSGIADIFVQHDWFRDGLPDLDNVVRIPYGCPEVDISDVKVVEGKVGTFGCAFPWKGLLPLAYACAQLNLPLDMYLSEPDSDKGQLDWQRTLSEIRLLHPRTEIWTEWTEQSQIVRRLASCAVIALPFDPCSPITGISASVRLALAAKRPLVLTKFFHFADLQDYLYDSIYWLSQTKKGPGNLTLKESLEQAVYDVYDSDGCDWLNFECYEEMKWSVVAQQYVDLYRKVTSGQSIPVGQS